MAILDGGSQVVNGKNTLSKKALQRGLFSWLAVEIVFMQSYRMLTETTGELEPMKQITIRFENWQKVLGETVPVRLQTGYREAITKFRYWLWEKGKAARVEDTAGHASPWPSPEGG